MKENKALVRAEVPARNDTVDIVYLMHRRQGKWRVYDLVIDDASTATGYRKRYARFLAKKSFQQLLARLGEQRQRLLVP